MATVKITAKPNITVSDLAAPTLSNRIVSASWSVPSAMTNAKSKSRTTGLSVSWGIDTNMGPLFVPMTGAISLTETALNLESFMAGAIAVTRTSFYPFTALYLYSISIYVAGTNSKGTGPIAAQTLWMGAPRQPVIDDIQFNPSTGKCTTTITADAGDDFCERYNTYYVVTVRKRDGSVEVAQQGASVDTEIPIEYDAADYRNIPQEDLNQYIQVTVDAWSCGYAGNSVPAVQKSYYISYPAKATIEEVSLSSKSSTGKVTVGISTNSTTEHPVDTVKLEYLDNVTYAEASSIPAGDSWSDAGIEDNGDCTALVVPLSISEHFVPDRGKYTWVRVKTIHADEATLVTYSDYRRIEELETPPAAAAETDMTILSIGAGTSSDSAIVQLAWNRSGTDDSTGTELSWATEEDTWRSTKEPEKFEFTWSDGSITHGGVTYHDSANIVIKGLTEGVLYHVKARRYYEGETISYGQYSNGVTVTPTGKPAGVVASCKGEVAEGEPLQVYWTFGGNGLQKEWRIMDSNGTCLTSGKGSICGAQISANTLKAFAVNNSISFVVEVSTGSEFEPSGLKTVKILNKPTLAVTAPATMTAQPYSFTATAPKSCDFLVIVYSRGASGQYPDGYKEQVDGDVVYSAYGKDLKVTWSGNTATITLPNGLDFWNNGKYTLYVSVKDRDTKLQSEPIRKEFSVAWANKAKDPDDFVTLTPIDTVSDENEHLQGVQIDLTPPTGSSSSDVYDIYRMEGDKAQLIGKGFPLTYSVVDEYAPFSDGDAYYRIALRTVDGDVEFAEKEYTLQSKTVRFDWQGGTLELPYGITMGDNYKKSVEFRQHMDGSVDGYWNQNIERGASYNSAIIKLIQPDEIRLARQLARYAGAVFVRTANGSAFTANVQITDLSVKNEAVTTIAIDATEVGMTDEFMLPNPSLGDGE